ncbi:MAG: DUF2953 domain-containing protein [Moorellaceae bacterium]
MNDPGFREQVRAIPDLSDSGLPREEQSPPDWEMGRSRRLFWSLRFWNRLAVIWGRFFRRVRWERFAWRVEVGAGNPAVTGLVAGILWNAAALVCINLYRLARYKGRPEIRIIPWFDSSCCRTFLYGTFSFALGYFIIAGIQSLNLTWRTLRDEGKSTSKGGRSGVG